MRHVELLMTGEGDLSEEFKRKHQLYLKPTVKSKVRSEIEPNGRRVQN